MTDFLGENYQRLIELDGFSDLLGKHQINEALDTLVSADVDEVKGETARAVLSCVKIERKPYEPGYMVEMIQRFNGVPLKAEALSDDLSVEGQIKTIAAAIILLLKLDDSKKMGANPMFSGFIEEMAFVEPAKD